METDIIARAYQLALESSQLGEVRTKLKKEGYGNIAGHFSSGQLKGQLTKRLKHQDT
jgi:hypothetical protein